MSADTKSVDVQMHRAAVLYWLNAAREQSRWFVQLRRTYRAEPHAHKRARLWCEAGRCRDRITSIMAEARRIRVEIARVQGGAK